MHYPSEGFLCGERSNPGCDFKGPPTDDTDDTVQASGLLETDVEDVIRQVFNRMSSLSSWPPRFAMEDISRIDGETWETLRVSTEHRSFIPHILRLDDAETQSGSSSDCPVVRVHKHRPDVVYAVRWVCFPFMVRP